MSLFTEYYKERENVDAIETDYGFVTYQFLPHQRCLLRDLYITPAKRNQGLAQGLIGQVGDLAIEREYKVLLGSVCLDAHDPTKGLNLLLSCGMKLDQVVGNMIFLKKDLGV